MKLLIIGKNGQLASSLRKQAEKENITFTAVSRDDCNITDQKAVITLVEKNNDVDFVINTAADTNVDGAEHDAATAMAVNANGVEYLAKACKKYAIPLIHMSTDYIFDGKKTTYYEEKDQPNPQGVYAQSKYQGEKILQNTWEKHIILRVSWVFSEYGKNFVKTISALCDQKETLKVIATQYGSPTSARSIAKVILHICQKIKNEPITAWGIYHYADFPVTNWHQLAEYVAKLKGKHTTVVAIDEKDYPLPAKRPKNSCLSTLKIKEVFGVEQALWMPEVARVISQVKE